MMSGRIEVVRRRAWAADICVTVDTATHSLMPYGENVLRGNEDAQRTAEQHSNIRFWAVINPRNKESYKQMESLMSHPLCKGIKIHPTDHAYDLRDYGDEVF